MKIKIWLILILILAVFLRFYRVTDNPPSLNWDEVSHGFNAYSILKTGKDEWGEKLPLIFRCFGDYKLPFYIYLTVLPVAVLGLNPFSVRLMSVLAGVGLVVVAYLIGEKITKTQEVGLLAAFLVAVSPWSLFLSRIAVEANLAAFLFSLGSYFWLSWCQDRKPKLLFLTALFWGLSIHTYNSARVLVPILLSVTLFFAIKKKRLKEVLLLTLLLTIFFFPVFLQTLNQSGGARFFWVSPIDQGAINRIIERRASSELPSLLTRGIYNRVTYFLAYSIRNYFNHFSPNFLFFKGGTHFQFSLPDQGILYLATAPFLVLGLILVVLKRYWFLAIWFLAAFIPSAITRDSPHVLRSILVLPLPMILSSLGINQLVRWLKPGSRFSGKLVLLAFILVISVNLSLWWRDYWRIYRPYYSWAWQFGYKEAVSYLKQHYAKYDKIILTKKYGEPHEFILFYWSWEPSYYQQDPKKIWDYHSNWYWIDAFDKFEFWNDWEIKEKLKVKSEELRVLLITSPGNYPEGWSKLETINFLDGEPAFEILE